MKRNARIIEFLTNNAPIDHWIRAKLKYFLTFTQNILSSKFPLCCFSQNFINRFNKNFTSTSDFLFFFFSFILKFHGSRNRVHRQKRSLHLAMTNNYSFHYVSIHLDTMFHTHIHMHRHVYTHALLYSIELFLLVKGRAPEIRARSFISLLFFPPSLYTLRPHFFELPLFATSFLLSPLLHRVPPDYRGST